MEVIFADKDLEKITGEEAKKLQLPVHVIKGARRKLTILANAVDERDLRNWRSLHYEKLSGDKDGLRSIRINDQWRIVFEIDTAADPNRITITAIEDYH